MMRGSAGARLLRNLVFCTGGAFLLALGIVVFLSPNHIVTGGPPGIAIILFHMLGIGKGLTILVANLLLMLLGLRRVGAGFLARTCYAFTATAGFTELLVVLADNPAVTASTLLNALYGGMLVGAGIGLIFKGEASAGGWSLLARLIAERFRLGVGQCIVLLDSLVIVSSAIVFRDIESALWAGIGVYVTGLVVDLVLTGKAGAKLVHVSSVRADLLARLLPARLRESGSLVHCNTMTDREGRDVMFLVIETGQISTLADVVRAHDPDAHVVVMDAVEFYAGGMAAGAQRP
jgi:uncharacterized membrane-anchored protein YitT (DUF2179 family)